MDESADSEFDMGAAQENIAAELFNQEDKLDPVEPDKESVDGSIQDKKPVEEEEPPVEEPKEQRVAPQSWKKEMHEHWSSLSPDVQDYIELREQQMREGIDVAKEDASLGRDLRDVLSPYNELLESQGIDQKTAVQLLLNAHHKLSTAQSDQERIDAFNQMAQSYGINLDGSKPTEQVQQLQNEINQLKQIVSQSQQMTLQEKQARTMQEVEAFASEHEFFDDVAEDLAAFIRTGMTLEEAYEKAIWANEVTREKELARLETQKQEKLEKEKHEKLEKAKKAKSANVKTRDTNKAPTGPKGKMFDDLNEIYEEIQGR